MPKLLPPDTRVHDSFLQAMAEFQAEGRGSADDESMVGDEIRTYGAHWADPRAFARYVEALRAAALPETPRPEGIVPCTTLWYADRDTYLGRLAIRHSLTPRLLETGGHIGYDVRPTARRRGHATAMLRAALSLARALGIEAVLVTCDADNTASRRVIEACGGALEDRRDDPLRFWIDTSGNSPHDFAAGRPGRGGPHQADTGPGRAAAGTPTEVCLGCVAMAGRDGEGPDSEGGNRGAVCRWARCGM